MLPSDIIEDLAYLFINVSNLLFIHHHHDHHLFC